MIIKRNDTHDIVTVNGVSFRFDLPEQSAQIRAIEDDPDRFEHLVAIHGSEALEHFFQDE